jgi:hypothetical protein
MRECWGVRGMSAFQSNLKKAAAGRRIDAEA